jgi:hypothetical protein
MSERKMSDSESLTTIESGPTHEVWRFKDATARLDWPRPNMIALTIVGHGHGEFAAPSLRRWDDRLRGSERFTVFNDFWDMPGYDSEIRLAFTRWAQQHRGRLEPIHLLTRSSLVTMGATVANIPLGGLLRIHTLRGTYDLEFQKHGGAPRRGGESR